MNRPPHRARLAGIAVGASIALASFVAPSTAVAGAPQPAQSPGDDERELAERFAPIIMVKEQADECDTDGEPFVPMPVEIVLDNPEIALRQMSRDDPVVLRGPSASDLAGLGEGFFLDFPGDSLNPACIYERGFDRYSADATPTIYAHVVQQPDEPGLLFVQYWFFWYYNDWNNKHESDWEGVTLKFETSSVEAALATTPVAIGFSQHEGGERADWGDDKLGKEGDRPIVYSSARSHASYFDSALYLGRAASEGFGCDDTSGPSRRIDPDVVVLPDGVDDPNDPLAWLEYRGRWGERQQGAFNGPTGPAAKDRWLEPAPWFEELREASVVIPSGDSGAAAVIDVFCDAVERGSRTLVTFTTSPVQLVVGLGLLALLVRWLARRTDWSRVPAAPIVRRRRAGQIIRAAGREYVRSPIAYLVIGLVYLPAAIAAGALTTLAGRLPVVSTMLSLAGRASGTSLVVAAMVGSIANIAAFVAVNGVVASYLSGDERSPSSAIAALRTGWHRRRDLFAAFIRSFAIVFVLLASFVGIPWAIRQLVRYQFIAHVVAFEGSDGHSALSRSAELTAGRWLHTAVVTASLNAGVGLTSLVVSLLLLVLASGLPLWTFSIIVSLVYAFVVPLAAIAMCLLYGDTVAEHSERGAQTDGTPAPVG